MRTSIIIKSSIFQFFPLYSISSAQIINLIKADSIDIGVFMFYKVGEFIQIHHLTRAIRMFGWIKSENQGS